MATKRVPKGTPVPKTVGVGKKIPGRGKAMPTVQSRGMKRKPTTTNAPMKLPKGVQN